MHTPAAVRRLQRRRSPVVAVLALGLLFATLSGTPDGGLEGMRALLIKSGDDTVREQFTVTLNRAVDTYRQRGALLARTRVDQSDVAAASRKLADLAAQKRDVRLAIAAALDASQVLHAAAGLPAGATGASLATAPFVAALTASYQPPLLTGTLAAVAAVADGDSAVAALQRDIERAADRDLAARRSHLALIARVTDDDIAVLRARHEELLAQASVAADEHDTAAAALARAQGDAAVIQAIMRDVHEQVLRLQAQMERIDARLRERAERDLLAKGLIDPSTIAGTRMASSAPDLRWPAHGRIAAGYLDADYVQLFGVPHQGIDIAVNQGTPVASAADGIVFLVRDGGATGYTYVLIGHRGGMATLYGHLSAVGVVTGQEVSAGQVIGLSGGRPGTPGAGPMTTAPHLHFEVIRQGVNVDPLEALPL